MIAEIWKEIKKNYILRKIITSLYYYVLGNRYYINGINNQIKFDFERNFPFIKNVEFNISGNDNTVVINSGLQIKNIKILISGDKNKIVFEEKMQMYGGCVWINGSAERKYSSNRR